MAYITYIRLRNFINIIAVCLLILAPNAYGQKLTHSPYSFYGIGEAGGLDNAVFSAFGNNFVGIQDSTILNYYNPASYNLLAKGQPLFSFGISSRLSFFNQGEVQEFAMTSSIQHIVMAFPVKKHFGLAFGVRPFSSRGYDFYSGEMVNSDSIVYNYSGSGNLNEVFAGISTDLFKLKNTRLAVGMNAGYVFGETKNVRKSFIYSTTSVNPPGGIDERISHLSTFHYDLGFYFEQNYRKHTFGLSGRIDPSQQLQGDFDYNLFYSGNVNNENAYDTIKSNSIDSYVQSASSYEFGLTYKYIIDQNAQGTRKLKSQLLVAASYGNTAWSGFTAPFNDSLPFSDAQKITFGVQFTPEIDFFEKMSTTKFYQRIHYRIGGYMNTLPYTINGNQLTDKALTFGFGIPIPTMRSLSSINLGFAVGNRGTSNSSSLNEKYYGINLGITIAPGITERWFRNLKLN
ncbi:MAG: hypothetical protein EP333_08970 [Bacteroidetes bacterium]|nr:MAG: hypothetical protein EP333_08970 [Bacteroidota bacterium]TNE97440.1 MAG: hypothetical protein EP322_06700 [Bacteroidota bacterium]